MNAFSKEFSKRWAEDHYNLPGKSGVVGGKVAQLEAENARLRGALEQLQETFLYTASDGRRWCGGCDAENQLPDHAPDCPFRVLHHPEPTP